MLVIVKQILGMYMIVKYLDPYKYGPKCSSSPLHLSHQHPFRMKSLVEEIGHHPAYPNCCGHHRDMLICTNGIKTVHAEGLI